MEYATLKWLNWHNNERLPELIGDIPAAEYAAACFEQENYQAIAA